MGETIQQTGALNWRDLQKQNDNFIRNNEEIKPFNLSNWGAYQNAVSGYNPLREFNPEVLQPVDYTGSDFGNRRIDKKVDILNQEALGNLENQRALNQSNIGKLASGIGKMGVITATTVADTFGIITGTVNLLKDAVEGNINSFGDAWNSFVDNPYSHALMEINEKAEQWMPNYVSDLEKDRNWFQNMVTPEGWANFLGDHILKNAGFFVGAALSGKMSAGAISKVVGLNKARDIFKNLALVSADGQNVESIVEDTYKLIKSGQFNMADKALQKSLEQAAKNVGRKELTTRTAASIIGSVGESRMEALSNSMDYVNSRVGMLNQAEQREVQSIEHELYNAHPEWFTLQPVMDAEGNVVGWNRVLTNEEGLQFKSNLEKQIREQYEAARQEVDQEAQQYANWSFGINMILTGGTNFLNFGKYFTGNYGTSKSIAGMIKKEGERFAQLNTKAEKAKAIAKGIIEGPIAEGPGQEMLQQATTEGLNRFEGSKLNSFIGYQLDPEASEYQISAMQAVLQGLGATYGEFDQWENAFVGALMAGIPMPSRVKTSSFDSEGKPVTTKKWQFNGALYDSIRESNEMMSRASSVIEALNKSLENPNNHKAALAMIGNKAIEDRFKLALDGNSKWLFNNAKIDAFMNEADLYLQADRWDEFIDKIKDQTDINEEDLDELRESFKDAETGESIYKGKSNEELLEMFKKQREEALSLAEDYSKIHKANSILFGESISPLALREINYRAFSLQDRENRIKDLSKELIDDIQKMSNTARESLGVNIEETLNTIRDLAFSFAEDGQYQKLVDAVAEMINTGIPNMKKLEEDIKRHTANNTARQKDVNTRLAELSSKQSLNEEEAKELSKLQTLQKRWNTRGANLVAQLQDIKTKYESLEKSVASIEDIQKDIPSKLADLTSLLIERNLLLDEYNAIRENPEKVDDDIAKLLYKRYTEFEDRRDRKDYETFKNNPENFDSSKLASRSLLSKFKKWAKEDGDDAAQNRIAEYEKIAELRDKWNTIFEDEEAPENETVQTAIKLQFMNPDASADEIATNINTLLTVTSENKNESDEIREVAAKYLELSEAYDKSLEAQKSKKKSDNADGSNEGEDTGSDDLEFMSKEELVEYVNDNLDSDDIETICTLIGIDDINDAVADENIRKSELLEAIKSVLPEEQDDEEDESGNDDENAGEVPDDAIDLSQTDGDASVETPSTPQPQQPAQPVPAAAPTSSIYSEPSQEGVAAGTPISTKVSTEGNSESREFTFNNKESQDVLHIGRVSSIYSLADLVKNKLTRALEKLKLKTRADATEKWRMQFLERVKAQEFIDSGELQNLVEWCKANGQPLPKIRFVQYRGKTDAYSKVIEDEATAQIANKGSHANTVFAAVEIPSGYKPKYFTPPTEIREVDGEKVEISAFGNTFYGSNALERTKHLQVLGVVDVDFNSRKEKNPIYKAYRDLVEAVKAECQTIKPDGTHIAAYTYSSYTTDIEHIFSGRFIKQADGSTVPLSEILQGDEKKCEGQFQIEIIAGDHHTVYGESLADNPSDESKRLVPLNENRQQSGKLIHTKNDRNATIWIRTKEADGNIYRKGVKLAQFSPKYTKDDSPMAKRIKKAIKLVLEYDPKNVKHTRAMYMALSNCLYIDSSQHNIYKRNDGKVVITNIKGAEGGQIIIDPKSKKAVDEFYDALKRCYFRFTIAATPKQKGAVIEPMSLKEIVESDIIITDLGQIHNAGASVMASLINIEEDGNFSPVSSEYVRALHNRTREDGSKILHAGDPYYKEGKARVFTLYNNGDEEVKFSINENGEYCEHYVDDKGKIKVRVLSKNDNRIPKIDLAFKIATGQVTGKPVYLTKSRGFKVYMGIDTNGNKFFLTDRGRELTKEHSDNVEIILNKKASDAKKKKARAVLAELSRKYSLIQEENIAENDEENAESGETDYEENEEQQPTPKRSTKKKPAIQKPKAEKKKTNGVVRAKGGVKILGEQTPKSAPETTSDNIVSSAISNSKLNPKEKGFITLYAARIANKYQYKNISGLDTLLAAKLKGKDSATADILNRFENAKTVDDYKKAIDAVDAVLSCN